MRKPFLFFSVLFLLSCFAFFCASWRFFIYAHSPAGEFQTKKILIVHGENLKASAKKLQNEGIIKNAIGFRWLALIKGYDVKIKAGEYLLSSAMSPLTVLDRLVNGKIVFYKITIPEGYTLKQIAEIVAAAGLVNEKKFLEAATNALFIKRLKIPAQSFEGYLFPDTYTFPKGISPAQIILKMFKGFESAFVPSWEKRAGELGFSAHEIVTLASIIEKETGNASERAIISSVFHNRLKKNMRLETDPTVIYGIENFNGNITRKDLETYTPYNTYKIIGLPPGPIASPGIKSLEAALFPADTPYLFFVSKNDGTHYFSSSLEEHQNAVQKYQLKN